MSLIRYALYLLALGAARKLRAPRGDYLKGHKPH